MSAPFSPERTRLRTLIEPRQVRVRPNEKNPLGIKVVNYHIGHGQQLARAREAAKAALVGTVPNDGVDHRRKAEKDAQSAQRRADFLAARTALKARKAARLEAQAAEQRIER